MHVHIFSGNRSSPPPPPPPPPNKASPCMHFFLCKSIYLRPLTCTAFLGVYHMKLCCTLLQWWPRNMSSRLARLAQLVRLAWLAHGYPCIDMWQHQMLDHRDMSGGSGSLCIRTDMCRGCRSGMVYTGLACRCSCMSFRRRSGILRMLGCVGRHMNMCSHRELYRRGTECQLGTHIGRWMCLRL